MVASFTMVVILFAFIVSTIVSLTLFKKFHISQESSETHHFNDAVLISGCDSGIGLELAKYFHQSCNLKIICGFLNPKQSQGYRELEVLSESEKYQTESTTLNKRLILCELDITSNDNVQTVVEYIKQLKHEGVIRNVVALINNAGIMTYGEFDWLTWEHIQTQIEVNLTGTIRLTRAMVPFIIESRGRIINVSSVNDTTVFPGISIYSATKSALSTLSRGIGYELRKFGAHVITIRLGDFARLTNIMAKHTVNQDDMWKEMNCKKKEMYKDFFHEFNKHLLNNYGMTSPKEFKNSTLFSDFRRAVFAKHPPTTITCAPLGFKLFYFVIELTPVWLQYHLLDLLIQFGFRWKPPRIKIIT